MATKIFAAAAPAPTPTDHHTRHPEFRGVQIVPRGLVVNVSNHFNADS
jgi:hypothetical protein